MSCIYAPLIQTSEREEWEEYSVENDSWERDGLDIQTRDKNYHGKVHPRDVPYPLRRSIHDSNGDKTGSGPFLPAWQSYPVSPVFPLYNYDASSLSPLGSVLPQVLEDKRVVISRVLNQASSNGREELREVEVTNNWAKEYISESEDATEPMSDIFFPILAEAPDDVTIFEDSAKDWALRNQTVVGVLSMHFYWRDFIKGILPSDSRGLVVVFENGCGQAFTYEINCADVEFLGDGDQHDSTYDHMRISSNLLDLMAPLSSSGYEYTGIPLSNDTCPYRLHAYPSARMESDYRTNNPMVYTIFTVVIFAFTSGMFLLYDFCISRRQRKIMYAAIHSAERSALLEAKVRCRTRKLVDANARLEDANRKIQDAAAAQMQHFACMSHGT